MSVTRTINGTLDRLLVNTGAEITYLGPTTAGNPGDLIRGFRVNPAANGDIIVTIDRSSALLDMEIFQEDAYATSNAPTGYRKFFDVAKAGKGKGVIAVTVTNAAKNYIVLLTFDQYSDASYSGTVVVP